MDIEFEGPIIYWRGPAPYYFVIVPPELSEAIHAVSGVVTYGWGMIPMTARVGLTTWTTALFPKDGAYAVPVKAAVRKALKVEEGDVVSIELHVG